MTDVERDPIRVQFLSPQLSQAYQTGDFGYISKSRADTKHDFEPIADLMEKHDADDIFNHVKDDEGHHISVINAPSGMFFTQVIDSDPATKDEDPNKERTIRKPTIKVGWFAKGGGRADSTRFWSLETFEKVTIIGISSALGYVIGNMVTKTLTGRVSQAAASAAAEATAAYAAKQTARTALDRAVASGDAAAIKAATEALRTATQTAEKAFLEGASKFVNPGAWTKVSAFFRRFPKATGGVVGLVAAIGIQIFIDFIWGRINKDFFVEVEIYNFDKKVWKVDAWHHDNGIVAGGGDFVAGTMPAVTDVDRFPWGAPVKGWPTASGVTYAFQNSFTVLDGVGIALRTIREGEANVGFALGYIVKALTDNRLTVRPGAPSSIKAFYDEESNWPSDRPKSVQCVVKTVDGDITIKGFTDALGGKDDHVYQYFLTIGGK